MPDPTQPSATLAPPTNLRVWHKRDDAVGIDWTPLKQAGVTYVVEQSSDGGTTWTLAGKGTSNYLGVGGLTKGKSYQWRITSVAATSSAPSAVVTFPPPAPAPVPAPPVVVTPTVVAASPITHGGISDDGDIASVATLYRELGLTDARVWFGVDAATGAGDEPKLINFKQYRDGGITPRIVLQPTLSPSPVFPAAAIASIRRLYPANGEIEVGNEGNLEGASAYFVGGYVAAARWASPVIDALGDDYVCSPPSMTGWFVSWVDWTKATIAAGLCKKSRKLCYHLYSNKPLTIDYAIDPVGAQKQIDAYLADTDYALQQAVACQALWQAFTGHAMPIDISEWGAIAPVATLVQLIPKMLALFAKHRVAKHAYYITTCDYETLPGAKQPTPKPTPDKYGWAVDRRAGTRREAIISAIKAATVAAALLTLLYAGTAVIDARNRAVTPLHAGAIAGLCDDQGLAKMSVADYAAWATREPAPFWIVDDETAAFATNAPKYLEVVRANAPDKQVGLYGALGGQGDEYWARVNNDAAGRQAIRDRWAALIPTLKPFDVLIFEAYPVYCEIPGPASDTDSLAAKIARDRLYLTQMAEDAKWLSGQMGGKPIAFQLWACDHETATPIGAERADAYIDAIPPDVNVILWGDGTPENGIGDRMIARRKANVNP